MFKNRKDGQSAFPGHGSALCRLLEDKQEIKFRFLKENSINLNVHHPCQTLQVSGSVFYVYLKRRSSPRQVENKVLKEMIEVIFYE